MSGLAGSLRAVVGWLNGVVLSKLEWAKLSGGSERQMRDVSGVLAMRGAELDLAYIESWLDVLAIRPLWDQVTASFPRA